MKPMTINQVKDGEVIVSNGDYVVIMGKHPWIFRKDGSFIARIKTIVRAYNHIFLPHNTVMLNSLAQRKIYYVSLETGNILWEIPHKKRSMLSPDTFFCSNDGETVYYAYQTNHKLCIDRIVPSEQKYESFAISPSFGAVTHCYCDSEDRVNMLYCVALPKHSWQSADVPLCQDGIYTWSPSEPSLRSRYQLQRRPTYLETPLSCNDDYILYENMTVLSMKTGDRINLLGNESRDMSVFGPVRVTAYDSFRNLLTVRATSGRAMVVIDCTDRNIAAHYSRITPGLSQGCLIDNEFWCGTLDGIVKRPFPHMDSFPRER